MNAFTPVLQWLDSRNIPLNSRQLALIRQFTELRSVKAKTILMQQDQPVQKFYFLNNGIVRLFRIQEGNDHTLGLINSYDFLAAPQLVLSGEASTCGLEALTDADLLEWDATAIGNIKQLVPEVYNIELALMARLLNWVQQNQIEMICFPAEKRYQLLLERQPEVVLNIPLKYIASFLGIHTDSLSRIRKAGSTESSRSRPRE
jgi:CRP-like cAMP-binding protein